MSRTTRVYNMSLEETGEGIPVRIDYAGMTYIFQPSNATYDFKVTQENWVDRGAQMAIKRNVSSFVEKQENNEPNYLDVSSGLASYIFQKGHNRCRGVLKSADEMQDIVDQQLREKQNALAKIEQDLELAEKKAASKKRGPGRPPKATTAEA